MKVQANVLSFVVNPSHPVAREASKAVGVSSVNSVTVVNLGEVKDTFITACQTYIATRIGLAKAFREAIVAGARPDDLRQWAKEAGCTPNHISKAMTANGLRQRAVRLDRDVRRFMRDTVDASFFMPRPAAKKEDNAATPSADGTSEASEVETTVVEEKATPADINGKIMAYGLNLHGGDKAKLVVALEAILVTLRS